MIILDNLKELFNIKVVINSFGLSDERLEAIKSLLRLELDEEFKEFNFNYDFPLILHRVAISSLRDTTVIYNYDANFPYIKDVSYFFTCSYANKEYYISTDIKITEFGNSSDIEKKFFEYQSSNITTSYKGFDNFLLFDKISSESIIPLLRLTNNQIIKKMPELTYI